MSQAWVYVCRDVSNRLHAYVDRALSDAEHVAVETHLRGCAKCRAELAQVRAIESRLRALWRAQDAPALDLWDRIRARLVPPVPDRSSPMSQRLRHWGYRAAVAAALVAALAMTTIVGHQLLENRSFEARFVEAPVEELKAFVDSRRPLDVATTDLGKLRQWFQGKINYAIPEPEIRDGVRLVGGRLCFFLERRIASMMYQADGRVLSLYVIPEDSHLMSMESEYKVAGEYVRLKRLGAYTQVMWQRNKIVYALVGDLPATQLLDLSSEFLRATREPV